MATRRQRARRGVLPKASGSWLVLLAYYGYGVTARPATFASGRVTLSNTAGGIYTYGPGEVSVFDSTTKKTYVNTEAIALGGGTPSSPTTQTIGVRALEVGSASSAPPGEIDALVTGMLGVTVSNDDSVVGLDAQSDDDLRALCLASLGASSVRGPRSAYTYAVQTATLAEGSPVNINRSSVSSGSHTGTVTVYIASPSGVPLPGDLAAVEASIDTVARPDGVTLILVAAAPVVYSPTLTVWALAMPGVTVQAVHDAVADALELFLSTYPIGGLSIGRARGLFASGVAGVATGAHPAIFAVDGATDLALGPGQVAVDAITTITVALVPVADEEAA